jgi:hypothetical protein
MKHLLNTTKNYYIVTILLILTNIVLQSPNIKAQDDEFENYAFDDNKKEKHPYFALGIGANLCFSFMNYEEINKKMVIPDKLNFDGPIIGYKIDFCTAMSPLVNNMRVGVSYYWGNQVKEQSIFAPPNEELGINFNRKLSVNNLSIHSDYGFVPVKSLAVLPGIGLNFGTMALEYYETSLPQDWNNNNNTYYGENLKYSYIAIEPKINIEYAITGFLMLRAAGSYVFAFDSPFVSNVWTINGNNKYSGVPKSVKPQGFSASIGLYIGLFNY